VFLLSSLHAHIFAVIAKGIYCSTKGHPGLVRKIVDLISEKFRRHGISNPSDDDVFQYMLSDEYINFISSTRAVPSESFSDIEKDLLRQVVLEGRIPSRQKDDEQMAEIKLVKAGTNTIAKY